MKKLFLIFLIFLLLGSFFSSAQNITTNGQRQFPGSIRTYGDIYSNDQGIDKRVITETTSDLTLYVVTTGSDSNNCLTLATACLTIQAAIDKVPRGLRHKAVINVGAGNFGAFAITGYSFSNWNAASSADDHQFQIVGANPINYTPIGGGTGSGTATGGTTSTLIDAGQGWAVNALRGKLVFVNSSWLIIRKNDATSLETVGISSSTMSGKAYVIQDWSTIINTRRNFRTTLYAGGTIYANSNSRYANDSVSLKFLKFSPGVPSGATFGLLVDEADIDLQYVSVDTCNYGFYVVRCPQMRFKNIVTTTGNLANGIGFYADVAGFSASSNFFSYNNVYGVDFHYVSAASLSYIYADNNSNTGFFFYWSQKLYLTYVYGDSNYTGLLGLGVQYLYIGTGNISNNYYGVVMGASSTPEGGDQPIMGVTGFNATNLVLNTNTRSGFYAGPASTSRLQIVTGTGNGTYGIYARYGGQVFMSSATTVTGTSGDVRVGTSTYSYAVDFVSDNSYIYDISDRTVVKRVDSFVF